MKDLNLPEYRLDFLRIVCSHEHYVILNLPLGTLLYPMGAGSQQSSPSGSISSTFENLDMPNVEAMGELSHEFRHFHYLSGLVLSELAQVLVDGKSVLHNTHTHTHNIECTNSVYPLTSHTPLLGSMCTLTIANCL